MRADPFNKNDRFVVIDCHYQSVGIAFDIENNSVAADQARVGIVSLHVGRSFPLSPLNFIEPGVQSRGYGFGVLAAFERLRKISEGPARYDSHDSCSEIDCTLCP